MSHEIESRDIQCGLENAWHNLTTVANPVTREIAHPFEVKPWNIQAVDPNTLRIVPLDNNKILLASDDQLPIGLPYQDSYVPNTIANFWKTLDEGMDGAPFEVVSAGSIRNRAQIFVSIRITDGFKIGDREFKDYITLMDSFDKSMAFTCLYSNVCVVCANTFSAAMRDGKAIGRAKHSKGFDGNTNRLVQAIDMFAGYSARFNALLSEANKTLVEEAEARCWIAGVNCEKAMGLSDLQKVARMTELFRFGKGNAGSTRLDAFSGVTDFHSHESVRSTEANAQWMASEFGTSRLIKGRALDGLEKWDQFHDRGRGLLKDAGALIGR